MTPIDSDTTVVLEPRDLYNASSKFSQFASLLQSVSPYGRTNNLRDWELSALRHAARELRSFIDALDDRMMQSQRLMLEAPANTEGE